MTHDLMEHSNQPWKGITLTLRKPLENNYDYRSQFFLTASKMLRTFPKYCSVFELYPEFTQRGRIHYHGRFKPKSNKDQLKLLQLLRQEVGFIKVESVIKHMVHWSDYCKKDLETSRELIKFNDIVLTDKSSITDLQERVFKIESLLRATPIGDGETITLTL